jgi:hypothetical protein
MRPEKALEPPRVLASAGNKKYDKDGKLVTGKRKKRVKLPPTRARRRTIDPTRWDSTHLKGIWLDAEVAGVVDVVEHAGGPVIPRKRRAEAAENSDNYQDTEIAPSTDDEDDDHESLSPPVPNSALSSLPSPVLTPIPTTRSPVTEAVTGAIPSLTQEKFTSLAVLHSLFGDKDGDEGWGGQESLSDIEDARLEGKGKAREPQTGTRMDVDGGDIEEVPLAKYKDMDMESDTVEYPLNSQSRPTSASKPSAQSQKQTKLKDLFAPREEEGVLLSHCIHLVSLYSSRLTAPHYVFIYLYFPPLSLRLTLTDCDPLQPDFHCSVTSTWILRRKTCSGFQTFLTPPNRIMRCLFLT